MNIFKRKNNFDFIFEEKKKKNKKQNISIFFLFFIIIIFALIFNILNIGSFNIANEDKFIELSDEQINTINPIKETNINLLKAKFKRCGLSPLSDSINALNINSSKNRPNKNLLLTSNEVAFLLNTMISFELQIDIVDISWIKISNSYNINLTINQKMNLENLKNVNIFYNFLFNYDLNSNKIKQKESKCLNFPKKDLKINKDELEPFEEYICYYLFLNEISNSENTNIQNITSKNNENQLKNKCFCALLGFKNLEINESYILYTL